MAGVLYSLDSIKNPGKRRFFYGWIVVIAAFAASTVAYGASFSFAVFLLPLQESFRSTSAATSGAFSICLLLYSVMGFPAGWGVDKYGPKVTTLIGGCFLSLGLILTSQIHTIHQLYMTYALIGIGLSVIYAPLMTTVTRWFKSRRGLALGIFSSGMGMGPLIMAPLASYVISSYGWRAGYLALGSSISLLFIAALFLKKDPSEIGEYRDGIVPSEVPDVHNPITRELQSNEFSLSEAVKTKAYWLLTVIIFLIGFSLSMMLAQVAAYGEYKGLSPIVAATVFSTVSAASIAGRLLMGAVSDRIGRKMALAISLILEGIMMVWLLYSSDIWMFYFFAIIFGFGYGGTPLPFPLWPAKFLD